MQEGLKKKTPEENHYDGFLATIRVIASIITCRNSEPTVDNKTPLNNTLRADPWSDGQQPTPPQPNGRCSRLLALPLACIFYPFTILCGSYCDETSAKKDWMGYQNSSDEEEQPVLHPGEN
jgi:hypothetical protein